MSRSETAANLTAIDDPRPIWFSSASLDSSRGTAWAPSFLYYNVYVLASTADSDAQPEDATFIATTGIDGHLNSLVLEGLNLPNNPGEERVADAVLVLVRGVTKKGEVVPWTEAAHLRIPLSVS